VEQIIRPALDDGAIVLADRYGDASIAYQGFGRDLGDAPTRAIVQFATGGIQPDRTYLFDLPASVSLNRVRSRGTPDRLEAESLEFHERVRLGYRQLAESDPGRFLVLDGTHGVDAIAAEVRKDMEKLLGQSKWLGRSSERGGWAQT
jgi:dTMP kinase